MTFRFLVVLVLGVLGLGTPSWAQTSGWESWQLTSAQRETLGSIVQSDPDAKAVYGPFYRTAVRALAETPNPIERIQTEGKLEKDPVSIASRKSLQDMPKIYALGLAWVVSRDQRFADKSVEFIGAWATVNQATGDPIDDTNLEPLVKAYDFLGQKFTEEGRNKVDGWLTRVANAEIASAKPRKTTSMNNWNSHRLKIVGLIGFTLKNRELINYATEGYEKQIAADLYSDGSSFDFQERDALHYHCYTLEPLLSLAMAAKIHGVDLYGYTAPSKSSLEASVNFLVPYATGKKTHPEFVHSKVKFDQERAAAGQADYQAGGLFRPAAALLTLEEEYFFDPSVLPLVQKLRNTTSKYPSIEILLEAVQSETLPNP